MAKKYKYSEKQAYTRLDKYCDKTGLTDSAGFYDNKYTETKVIYVYELSGKKYDLSFDLKSGNITDSRI